MTRKDIPVTDTDFEFALQTALDGFIFSDTGMPGVIEEKLATLPKDPPQVLIDNIRAAWEQLKRERPEEFTD